MQEIRYFVARSMQEMANNLEQKAGKKPIIHEDKVKRGRKAGAIIFPRDPLQKVLPIAEAVWTQNAGNPMPMLDLAAAINMSPSSSSYKRLLASSFRYGLTEGSPQTKIITLTPLGRSIVAPTVNDDPQASLRKALTHSEVFNKFYSMFNDKPIPREEILKNTLANPIESGGFGIVRDDIPDFIRVVKKNIDDYGLAHDISGTTYLRLSKLSPKTDVIQSPPESESQYQSFDEESQQEPPLVTTPTEEKQIPKQIFVAHGKNTKPLEQLKAILTQFKIPFQVAIDDAHKGRPISAKVAQLMKECTSGIFIFTADEEATDQENKKVLRPSDNVVFELGAGTVLYGNKIVIFREEGVDFGSDFTDIGRITFEKDKLDAKSFELMKELISLGFLQVSPT